MPTSMAPVKTSEGQDELTHRTRRLSQRHRTVLLLVDGRRSAGEVRQLAGQAGVPDSCFDELVTLGLIDCAEEAELTDDDAESLPPGDSSLTRSAQSLAPDSGFVGSGASGARSADAPFEEARGILLRAVRNEAPVTGSLTMLKLKRATTRDELAALLDEVELRIRKPRKLIIAAQLLRHVRHLLSLPAQ